MKTNLEILLSEWGRWQAGMNRTGLGYPSETSFSKMRVDCDRHASVGALLVDDDLRRIDMSISRLHPDVRVVVVAHYVWAGVVKVKAHRLRLAPRQYYLELEHAHKQLSHDLGGRYSDGFETKLCAHLDSLCA